jgi:uncharacterized membrane protein
MMPVLVLKWLHVVGAAALLGTGAGIAFFMAMAHRTGDARLIAHTARIVVVADAVFTATAVVAQPITGLWLAHLTGWHWSEGWILASIALYVFTGLLWLPVVWIQLQLRDIAAEAARAGRPLPTRYAKLFRTWIACGWPAFAAVLTIVWLMSAKPAMHLG